MITSFDIKNFRCFKELSLTDLPTINIVVGDNGSGKTALLEALLLTAYAHPQAAQFIRVARKRTLPTQVNWSRDVFQSLWADLFYSFDHSNAVQARFTDSSGDEYSVKLYYPQTTISPALSVADAIPPLEGTRSGPNDKSITAQLRIDDKGNPVWDGSLEWHPAVYLLPSTTQFLPSDMVEMFGRVSKQNLKDDFLEALKADFEEILDIEILPDGSDYALFATIRAPEKTKIPLAVVSAGAARYVNTLLAVILHNNGLVLVDEIENGLYWRKMPNIWQRLREICVERGVQLFATTHSNECLQSLTEAMEGHENDFSLLRTVVIDGEHRVRQFDGETFLAALKQHGEIR